MTRHPLRALLLAALAALTVAPAAHAGGSITVRTGQAGAELHASDLSARGEALVAWQEHGIGGAKGGMASASEVGGAFNEWMAVTDYQQLRVDACPAPLSRVAAGTEPSGADTRMFLAANRTQRIIEEAGTDYLHPDVACVDAKLVVLAVLVRKRGATRLIVWTFKPDLTDGARFGFDLGRTDAGSAPTITAADGWVHVAWVDGSRLKLKRFKVGSAPGFTLSAKPTTTIETFAGQRAPRLGADGKRVVLAWERGASVVARISTDRGVSFGARKIILKGDKASAKVALIGSADVRGTVVVVSGAISSEGITMKGRAMVTGDGGRTWRRAHGEDVVGGMMLAALDGPRTAPVLLLAADERLTGNDPQVIIAWSGTRP